jgi:hypothetical protein
LRPVTRWAAVLESAVLARCPNCRNTFSTDHGGRQNCPSCGKPLLVPEPEPALHAELVSGSDAEPQGTPWERRAQLGLLSGWAQTMQQALLEPTKLFASARLDRGKDQLGFAVLTASVFSIIGQLLNLLLSGSNDALTQQLLQMIPSDSPARPWIQSQLEAAQHPSAARIFLPMIAAPLVALIFTYLNAAVTHGVAALIGQSKRGFPATFAACTYAMAPLALAAVPACGSFIGVLWVIVLTGVGMKVTHRISTGGAMATALTPYLLCCCLIAIGSVAGASLIARAVGAQ